MYVMSADGNMTRNWVILRAVLHLVPSGKMFPKTSNVPCASWGRISFLKNKKQPPAKPTEPKPTEPKPTEPKPTEPVNDDVPITSDSNNVLLWVLLVGISAIGMLVIAPFKKKGRYCR